MKNLFTVLCLVLSMIAFFAGAIFLIDSSLQPSFNLEWLKSFAISVFFFGICFTLNMMNHYEIYDGIKRRIDSRRAVKRLKKFESDSKEFRREAISRAERHTRRARQVALNNFGK